MRITCDTNVLVSGILFGGLPRQILELISRGELVNIISLDILKEAQTVLQRDKFGLPSIQVAGIIDLFTETFVIVAPVVKVQAVQDDPSDNRILEAAFAGHASVIVSGDNHLLSLGVWDSITVLNPSAFLNHFEKTRKGL